MRTHLRLAALSALFISSLAQAADLIPIEVHRDANCGCCKKWVSHLEPTASRSKTTSKPI